MLDDAILYCTVLYCTIRAQNTLLRRVIAAAPAPNSGAHLSLTEPLPDHLPGTGASDIADLLLGGNIIRDESLASEPLTSSPLTTAQTLAFAGC